jgi:hypothetical protein
MVPLRSQLSAEIPSVDDSGRHSGLNATMLLRNIVLPCVLLAGLAAGCGSDESTRTADGAGTSEESTASSVESADDPGTSTDSGADATLVTADDAAVSIATTGMDDAVAGDLTITYTVLNSQQNPSLNGVAATVTGFCSVRATYDIFQIGGGEKSDPSAADRPDYVAFIGNAPVDGNVSGLLTVVEQGLESSSLSATGTFDGTTLSIADADTSEPLFQLVLSAPCTES